MPFAAKALLISFSVDSSGKLVKSSHTSSHGADSFRILQTTHTPSSKV